MTQNAVRIGKVTLKGGAQLHVLPNTGETHRGKIERSVREVLDGHAEADYELAGYAFVVWDRDGSSSCVMQCGEGSIPSMLAPDFVRNRLMAAKIIEWAND